MLAKLPDETTQLLIDLCSGSELGEAVDEEPSKPQERNREAGPSYLSYITGNRASMVFPVDLNIVAAFGMPGSNTNADTNAPTVPEVEKEADKDKGSTRTVQVGPRSTIVLDPIPDSPKTAEAPLRPRFSLKRPSPRQYFAHFIDHPEQFIRFLEAVAWNRWEQKVPARGETVSDNSSSQDSILNDSVERRDQAAIWNTLLELYLTISTTASKPEEYRVKALQLLKHHEILPYDPTHALIVCSTRSFMEGLVLLWEQMGMYEDVLRYWMDKENEGVQGSGERPSVRVLKYLKLYGPTHPFLYPLVLRFLTSTPARLSRHTTDVMGILEHIDREKIMPPLGVIQLLSRNNVASVGLVKQWLIKRINESREEISAGHQLINSYRTETKAKQQEITELTDPQNPRVFHVTRCSACGGQLDLPAVHFMCKHSYHQRCLADHEIECPNCAQAHGLIRELRRENERFATQHEIFLHNVEETGFEAVAAAFGRSGLMEMSHPDQAQR
jgi:hypothetical protein